jgi:uncharacterized protein
MKPKEVFDRDVEWSELTEFAATRESALGVVSGRRRTGKSFLLRHLVNSLSPNSQGLPRALYLQAVVEGRSEALSRIGDAVGRQLGVPDGSIRPKDWVAAFELLLGQAELIVLDEFPYLLDGNPDLLSSLQKVLDDRVVSAPKTSTGSGVSGKLILCGSSLSVMGSLLSGSQPLRGRASLDLRVEPFDFRSSRLFWGIKDFRIAFLLDAAIGGAAGYRSLSSVAAPTTQATFDRWVQATVLNPSHALYREDEFLLAEDSQVLARSLYRSAIGAIGAGEGTPTRLGGRLGRDRTSLSHILTTLQKSGWVRKDVDLLNERSVVYELVDPIVRFASLLIAPNREQLDERRSAEVWESTQPTWESKIIGPHFESITRRWLARYADPATVGGRPARVGRLTLNDPTHKTKVELDACSVNSAGTITAIGEAKATRDKRTVADIDRLLDARRLLPKGSADPRLFLFSLNGFHRDTEVKAKSVGVELVDLERLYEGS